MSIDRTLMEYRLGVGIILINSENKVFVGQRLDQGSGIEAWQMPQGGIDEAEEPLKAALRELKEEVGTDNVQVIHQSKDWYYYDIPDDYISRLWNGKYRGQKQLWFLMRLMGDDSLIDLNTEHPEFKDWKWVNIQQVPDLIVPFKKRLYKEILDEFLPIVSKR